MVKSKLFYAVLIVGLLLAGLVPASADTVITLPLTRFQTACSTLLPTDPIEQSYILFENTNPGVKGTFLLFSGGQGQAKGRRWRNQRRCYQLSRTQPLVVCQPEGQQWLSGPRRSDGCGHRFS